MKKMEEARPKPFLWFIIKFTFSSEVVIGLSSPNHGKMLAVASCGRARLYPPISVCTNKATSATLLQITFNKVALPFSTVNLQKFQTFGH